MRKLIFLFLLLATSFTYAQHKTSGKFGMADTKGNIILPFEYDTINYLFYDINNYRFTDMDFLPAGFFGAKKNGRWGVVNKDGKEQVPFIYDHMKRYTEDGLIIVTKDKKEGVIDINGNVKVPIRYNSIKLLSRGLLEVEEEREKGKIIIDTACNVIFPTPFISAQNMCSNRIWILINEYSWGAIDKEGKIKIPFQFYTRVENFSQGYAKVAYGDNWGVIDTLGSEIIPVEYSVGLHIDINSEGENIIVSKSVDEYGLYGINGKMLIPCVYEYLSYQEGVILASKDDKCGIIDIYGNIISDFNYKEFGETGKGLIAALDFDDKYGVIDTKGEIVIPFIYDYISYILDDYIIVCEGDKMGVIDRTGKLIIPCQYEFLEAAGNGYFKAIEEEEQNNFGLIDINNKLVLPYQYQDILIVNEKDIIVTKNYLSGIIDFTGKTIIPCEYARILYRDDRIILKKP